MVLTSSEVWKLLSGTEGTGAKAQQHGVDLTVHSIRHVQGGEIYRDGNRVFDGILIDPELSISGSWMYELTPGKMYSVHFEQGITLPGNVKANVIHRSSLLRSGTILMSAEYDPGFSCENIGAFMYVTAPLKIEARARIAQVVCYRVADGANLYNGQYQGEKANV